MNEDVFEPICTACELSAYETGTHCDCGLCQDCCQCGSSCECSACIERLNGALGAPSPDLPVAGSAQGAWRELLSGLAVALLISLGVSADVAAKDFGSVGQLYPVIEDDFLEMITTGFQAMEDDGRMARLREQSVAQVKRSVLRPRGAILPRATTARRYAVDLSITLERDLMDAEGRIFARAGTVVNPLMYSRFNKRIVMIDGDDPDQVAFALAQGNELNTLIVLARGSWRDLMSAHGRRFWFDMDQQMLTKFGIAALPSVITRADPVMLVEEVPLEGKGSVRPAQATAGPLERGGQGQ